MTLTEQKGMDGVILTRSVLTLTQKVMTLTELRQALRKFSEAAQVK